MADRLSSYTLDNAVNRVLTTLSITLPDTINFKSRIVAAINQRQLALLKKMWAQADFNIGQYQHTISDIDLSSGSILFSVLESTQPSIAIPVRLEMSREEDGILDIKQAVALDGGTYHNAENLSIYNNAVLVNYDGRIIRIKGGEGADIAQYNYNFVYLRRPQKVNLPEDLLDIPDEWYEDLINSVAEMFAPQKVIAAENVKIK